MYVDCWTLSLSSARSTMFKMFHPLLKRWLGIGKPVEDVEDWEPFLFGQHGLDDAADSTLEAAAALGLVHN